MRHRWEAIGYDTIRHVDNVNAPIRSLAVTLCAFDLRFDHHKVHSFTVCVGYLGVQK